MFSVGFTDLENCSLWSKLENKTGEVSADGKIFSFRMKKQRNVDCRLSVKFLSYNISRSPQLLEAAQSEAFQTSNYQELSAFLLAAAAAGLEAGAAGFSETSGLLSKEELSLLESGFLAGVTFTGAFLAPPRHYWTHLNYSPLQLS